jgi:beta-galactosidase
MMIFPNTEAALAAPVGVEGRYESPFAVSLAGDWRFDLVDSPMLRDDAFYATDFDDSEWNVITVPSNW